MGSAAENTQNEVHLIRLESFRSRRCGKFIGWLLHYLKCVFIKKIIAPLTYDAMVIVVSRFWGAGLLLILQKYDQLS